MVEAHAVQDAGAAIVPGDAEALEAERRHHLDLVLRHGAERIVLEWFSPPGGFTKSP